MEAGIPIFLAEPLSVRSLPEEVHRMLALGRIRFVPELENDCRIAIAAIFLQDQSVFETIHEKISILSQRDYRVMVISLRKDLSDGDKWQLTQLGAGDVISYHHHKESLSAVMEARAARWQTIEALLQGEELRNRMIGDCRAWKRFLRKIIEAAYFTNCNIVLTGASGTGKELTANLIHHIDQRKEKGRMVLVDCTTLSPELAGSEFYGHERGAFTNAVQSRDGAFALADKGTIFLDELGDLPLPMQAGLLRVVQEGSYKRLGSNSWQQTRFRLISATNRDLQEEVHKGRFREDLYFRVSGAVFRMPSLEDRKEDVPELTRYFLRSELKTIVAPEIEQTVMNHLVGREYPGNIRELKQLVARIAMRYCGEGMVSVGDLPEEELGVVQQARNANRHLHHGMEDAIRLAIACGKDLSAIKNEIIALATDIAMEECGGSIKLAARRLNVEVRTLQYIRKRGRAEPSDG